MVAGDLVNTASRVQSLAPPGSVYVGEATKRLTESAVVYEDAGSHELKGKSGLIPLWRAVRVVAGVRGTLKSYGLEAPFVGRDRDLRLTKELFHGSAEEGRAHLVSVVGMAGTGKSRLMWEFFKYSDGLAIEWWWHRGRCPAYGEGVTYWALAEMVKMRARIAEDEPPDSAAAKLRAAVEEHVPDPEERRWIEPRLAHLLGLEERTVHDRDDLFAAWRRFFEHLAERSPCVMVFEDVQWADASLLDFIEHLLEWSRGYPIYVLTLARPELLERRPHWGAGWRNFTSIYLEPLPASAMEALLSGLVPGLPKELLAQILERAEGVPLYAVETVRMLLDRGLLVQEGSAYRPVGHIETLEVPESLHALIAARLDGLSPEERKVLQDGAVLGKTFTKPGLAALSGMSDEQLDALLASLVRKEVLSLQADPRSPEHGQYGFLQELVKTVAYDTLSKKERRVRHLAAAEFIERGWTGEEDEIVEVVAAHYLEAYQEAPDADDAEDIRGRARDMLVRAGERAASLAATGEAQRYFEQAGELADEAILRAELAERAGEMALRGARLEEAASLLNTAMTQFEAEGRSHSAARVAARLGEAEWLAGRQQDALQQMEQAFGVLAGDQADEDLATLAAQLGRFYTLAGQLEQAGLKVDVALETAEELALPEVISQALNSKGIIALYEGRLHEGLAFFKHALEIGLENDIPLAAFRGYNNVAEVLSRQDRYEESAEFHRRGLALARRVGNRVWEWNFIGELSYVQWVLGEWDQTLAEVETIPEPSMPEASAAILASLPQMLVARGHPADAKRIVPFFVRYESGADRESRSAYHSARAGVARAAGRYGEALEAGRTAFADWDAVGTGSQGVKEGFVQAGEAALAAGETGALEDLLAVVGGLSPGRQTTFLRAHAARFRGRAAIVSGGDPGGRFKEAAGLFREHSMRFWLAVTLLEHGDWLTSQGRAEEAKPLVDEARETFERLKAAPWLERAEHLAVREPIGGGET